MRETKHISFQIEIFSKFMDVANTSCRIIQEWVIHLNDGIQHLTFCIIGQFHMVHFVDSLINIHSIVSPKGFHQTIRTIKVPCIVAYDLVVFELEQRFLDHKLMNDLGIIYPQYWL
jgi:hypothetical protein